MNKNPTIVKNQTNNVQRDKSTCLPV